jgi:hypothetical protein
LYSFTFIEPPVFQALFEKSDEDATQVVAAVVYALNTALVGCAETLLFVLGQRADAPVKLYVPSWDHEVKDSNTSSVTKERRRKMVHVINVFISGLY